MSAQDTILSQTISNKLSARTEELLAEFPAAATWVDTYEARHSLIRKEFPTVAQKVSAALSTEKTAAEYLQQISHEEFLTVMDKLEQFMQSGLDSTDESKLYLEQQVSDLLGFSISSELQGHTLPHSAGTLAAGKHLMRYPGDSVTEHIHHLEAGISNRRSSFGWFSQLEPASEEYIAIEQYWIGLALTALPEWGSNQQQLAHWWKHRKLLVINPTAHTFVVAAVADTIISTIQMQYMGSPELIRASNCWSPGVVGKVLVFFIDDSQADIPVGPISVSF